MKYFLKKLYSENTGYDFRSRAKLVPKKNAIIGFDAPSSTAVKEKSTPPTELTRSEIDNERDTHLEKLSCIHKKITSEETSLSSTILSGYKNDVTSYLKKPIFKDPTFDICKGMIEAITDIIDKKLEASSSRSV